MSDREDLTRFPEPVDRIPTDPERYQPQAGIALCLSGGGFRAMLFHLGALWRLNEAGLLPRLSRISSVSGGSITAGVTGLRWKDLAFAPATGIAGEFGRLIVEPIRRFAQETIDVGSIIGGILLPGSVSDRIAKAYRKHLFGDATLQALPTDPPRFVFNATNVQSKALWRFSKPYAWDYRVGKIEQPRTPLATAVAASSAFPPFLSPLSLSFKGSDYVPGTGDDLQRPPFTTEVRLTDGGVYDNLGLETAWKRYDTILASDAGGQYAAQPEPKKDWIRHTLRVLDLVDNQVRSLRKRQLIGSLVLKRRKGAYWGIWTDIANYELPDALPCPIAKTEAIAQIPTRLAALSDHNQELLIDWGYAVCDAALRKHFDPSIPRPLGFPYPNAGVG